MEHLSWDVYYYLPLIMCMESSDNPVEAVKDCIGHWSKLNYTTISTCANGPEGNGLHHLMGVKTETLVPPHKYVPWIVVNGGHNEEIQKQAQTDLLGLVCQLYKVDIWHKDELVLKDLLHLLHPQIRYHSDVYIS